jgi:5'-3' exonuclease
VFAFDTGRPRRCKLLPSYKSARAAKYAEESEEEQAARRDFHRQVQLLRTTYLPATGFRNVFAAHGFEADDIIAALAAGVPPEREAVIVSSDKDLWQCLRPNVYTWNAHTRRAYTYELFRAEWGLEPSAWANVKALAGCNTDNVPGVPGVGEKTAARHLRGELGATTKAAAKIAVSGDLHTRNLAVVRLPYPNTPIFDMVPDEVTEAKWQALADMLGMNSIRATVPRAAKKQSRGRKRGERSGFGLGDTV